MNGCTRISDALHSRLKLKLKLKLKLRLKLKLKPKAYISPPKSEFEKTWCASEHIERSLHGLRRSIDPLIRILKSDVRVTSCLILAEQEGGLSLIHI